MRILSTLTGGVAAAALLAVSATPAAARGGPWDGPRPRHHHHDRGPSAGAVIGTIAAVGILAAIASAASKKKQETAERRYEDAPYPDEHYDDRDDRAPRYDSRPEGSRYEPGRSDLSGQDEAVDACVIAARDEASRNGDYAEILGVTGVGRLGNGWDVSGRVEQRQSYRAADSWTRNFRCAFQNGTISAVSLD